MSFDLLIALGTLAVFVLWSAAHVVVIGWRTVQARLAHRRAFREAVENERMRGRLPPHERCSCSRCVEWRNQFSETLREGS